MNDGTVDRVNFHPRENESKIKIVVVEWSIIISHSTNDDDLSFLRKFGRKLENIAGKKCISPKKLK